MTRWQLLAGPASGGTDLSLTEAHARRLNFRLTDSSEVAFSMDGRHPQALAIDELRTDVHVLWTGDDGPPQRLLRARVGPTGDTLTAEQHTVDATALDYRAVLDRRRLFLGDTLTWAATDQAEIAWGLVQQTQGNTAGNLGINKAWSGTTPTGVPRTTTYELGDSIGERIQELSELNNGFDWDIVPVSASGLQLGIWYPQRGASRGVVLEHGGAVANVRREVQPGDYGNALRMSGDDNATPAVTPVEREATNLATLPEGRWDVVIGDTGLTTQAMLEARADWQIAQSQVVQPTYTLTLKRGAWRGPGHIWLGDTVRTVVISGRLHVDTDLRVYELGIALGDDGGEDVQVTVGGPKPDYRRRAAMTQRRLTNLERR